MRRCCQSWASDLQVKFKLRWARPVRNKCTVKKVYKVLLSDEDINLNTTTLILWNSLPERVASSQTYVPPWSWGTLESTVFPLNSSNQPEGPSRNLKSPGLISPNPSIFYYLSVFPHIFFPPIHFSNVISSVTFPCVRNSLRLKAFLACSTLGPWSCSAP